LGLDKSDGRVLAFGIDESYRSQTLDRWNFARRYSTVAAPTPKTLGNILFADGSSENEWLQLGRAIAGDQRALHSLYEQTHRIVFTLIVRMKKRPGN
jgi:prepilin-type processing-associated H-X9-DG protein